MMAMMEAGRLRSSYQLAEERREGEAAGVATSEGALGQFPVPVKKEKERIQREERMAVEKERRRKKEGFDERYVVLRDNR